MAWASAAARVAAAPRTRVGPATVATERTGPDGKTTWRGVWTSPVTLHRLAGIERSVYAIARCVVSEVGTSNAVEALAVAETIVNASLRKGVEPYQYLAGLTSSSYGWTRWYYGEQRGRRASTRQDPDGRAVAAAKLAMTSSVLLVNGAVSWFDPQLQDSGRYNYDAAGIARKWATEDALEWIGPLPSVDSYRDVAFLRKITGRPADPAALIRLIELGRAGRPTVGPASPDAATAQVAARGMPWWAIAGGAVLWVL